MDEQERAAFAEAVAERVAQRLMSASLPPGSSPTPPIIVTTLEQRLARLEALLGLDPLAPSEVTP